jgi:hypothetical protein
VKLPDPPFPGKDEKAIAATRPQQRSQNVKQPDISLDSQQTSVSVLARLHQRGSI